MMEITGILITDMYFVPEIRTKKVGTKNILQNCDVGNFLSGFQFTFRFFF